VQTTVKQEKVVASQEPVSATRVPKAARPSTSDQDRPRSPSSDPIDLFSDPRSEDEIEVEEITPPPAAAKDKISSVMTAKPNTQSLSKESKKRKPSASSSSPNEQNEVVEDDVNEAAAAVAAGWRAKFSFGPSANNVCTSSLYLA
jgi:hypothetical protein